MALFFLVDLGIKTHAIVLYFQLDAIALVGEVNQYFAGLGMFADVGQGFLHNENQLQLLLRAQILAISHIAQCYVGRLLCLKALNDGIQHFLE